MDLSELESMGQIGEALKDLDNEARKRVIKWAVDKFKIDGIEFVDSANHNSEQSKLNTFEYEETQEKRSVRASFTDEVGNNVSQTLGRYISRTPGESESDRELLLEEAEAIEPSHDKKTGSEPESIPEEASEKKTTSEEVEAQESDQPVQHKLNQVFRYEGDTIRLDNPRLKATSQRDFVRRLTYLFLFAHRLEGRDKVSRAQLNEALKECSVYDGNARKFITQDDGLIREDGNKILGLNLVGRERAREVLEEVLDPDVENKWSITSAYN